MKRYIVLFIIAQILDITTTIIGVYDMGFIELNTIAPLKEIIHLKIIATIFVTMVMIKMPKRKIYNAIWIVSIIPVVWNVFNIVVEIIL